MLVLGLDFETTGLNSTTDRVIEVGAVVWETHEHRPVALFSELIRLENGQKVSAEITQLTGIENDDLQQFGVEVARAFERLNSYMERCDFVVAHNANFDRSFYLAESERLGLSPVDKPWIDTLSDLPLPDSTTSRKLNHLAADHGFVNPFSHRATFDVMTMLQLLKHYDMSEVVERQASASVQVIAHVSYDKREDAKKLGFRWNPERKIWAKQIKECDLSHVSFPFQVTQEEMLSHQ